MRVALFVCVAAGLAFVAGNVAAEDHPVCEPSCELSTDADGSLGAIGAVPVFLATTALVVAPRLRERRGT